MGWSVFTELTSAPAKATDANQTLCGVAEETPLTVWLEIADGARNRVAYVELIFTEEELPSSRPASIVFGCLWLCGLTSDLFSMRPLLLSPGTQNSA